MANNIKRSLKHVREECDVNTVEDSGCKIKALLLDNEFRTSRENLEKLYYKRRVRRFTICEWCGKLQHFLYGTVDADEAREILNVINNSSKAIGENRKILYNTTHIVKAMLQEEEGRVNEIHKILKEFHDDIKHENDKMNRRDLLSIVESLIAEFKSIIELVDQAFTAQVTGQIPKIIKTDDFLSQFQSIIKSLKSGTTFPIHIFQNDISEIFQIASLHTTRIKNTILLKITLPICESEIHSLFKVTTVPIITNNAFLIAEIEYNYFIINAKQTEFIEMSEAEVKEGIGLNGNEVLYKTKTLTKLNSKMNCIWSQFLSNDIKKLITTCKLSPIRRSNYITSINENDLYYVTVAEPMIFWETCEDRKRKFNVTRTGFLQTKPKCTIITDNFLIKTHDNTIINFTDSIEPFLYGGSFSFNAFDHLVENLNYTNNELETKLIDSKSALKRLIEETNNLIGLADKPIVLQRLEHDSPMFSFSISLPSLLIFGPMIILIVFCFTMYYFKCSMFKCWYNILKREEKKPKKFELKSFRNRTKTEYRKTPYVTRKNFENDIERGDENEHDSE